MFARQQILRQGVQRMAQRRMGSSTNGALYKESETIVATGKLPQPLDLPWTPEQEAGLQQFQAELRNKMKTTIGSRVNPKYPFYQNSAAPMVGPPKYSRPFVNIFGVPTEARSVWLFPLTFTAGIVIYTNILEFFGADVFTRPLFWMLGDRKVD